VPPETKKMMSAIMKRRDEMKDKLSKLEKEAEAERKREMKKQKVYFQCYLNGVFNICLITLIMPKK